MLKMLCMHTILRSGGENVNVSKGRLWKNLDRLKQASSLADSSYLTLYERLGGIREVRDKALWSAPIHILRGCACGVISQTFLQQRLPMGEAALQTDLSIQEYLAFEKEATLRHEYHAGEIFAMAGGTRNHGKLGLNIGTELNLIERGRACTTFNGDVKIWIAEERKFLYPEASVVCGPVEVSEHDPEAIANPLLIAEVLSETTEAYDRGKKFRYYRTLPSFREYLLIDQEQPIVSIFYKNDQGTWEMGEVKGLDGVLHLRSLQADIQMADLYRNVEGMQGQTGKG